MRITNRFAARRSSPPALAAALLSVLLVTPLARAQTGASDTYIIGVGDLLKVSVWKNPDLEAEVLVERRASPFDGDGRVRGRDSTFSLLDPDL